MRKKIIAGNWKMNKTPSEAVEFANALKSNLNSDKVDVVFCGHWVQCAAHFSAQSTIFLLYIRQVFFAAGFGGVGV